MSSKKPKLTRKVTIRMSEEDYQKYLSIFADAQTAHNYTQSNFIRDCIFSAVPPKIEQRAKPTLCERERVKQISGLTSNINQIAYNLNLMQKYPRLNNEHRLLYYLNKLETIAKYCDSALFEDKAK